MEPVLELTKSNPPSTKLRKNLSTCPALCHSQGDSHLPGLDLDLTFSMKETSRTERIFTSIFVGSGSEYLIYSNISILYLRR